MGEYVRFGASFAADVEGGRGDVGVFDVHEEARGGEARAVDGGDSGGEVVFLGGG